MGTIEDLIRDKKLAEEKIAIIMADLHRNYPEAEITLNHTFEDEVKSEFGGFITFSSNAKIKMAL